VAPKNLQNEADYNIAVLTLFSMSTLIRPTFYNLLFIVHLLSFLFSVLRFLPLYFILALSNATFQRPRLLCRRGSVVQLPAGTVGAKLAQNHLFTSHLISRSQYRCALARRACTGMPCTASLLRFMLRCVGGFNSLLTHSGVTRLQKLTRQKLVVPDRFPNFYVRLMK